MIDKQEQLLKIKNFRDKSIYFYMASFFMITVMFIFYLVGSKNNRSCQYGSTLYCNTEKFYYVGSNKNQTFLQLEFDQPTGIAAGTSYTLGFPYNDTPDYYNIIYYFNEAAPSNVTNIFRDDNNVIGVSLQGTTGASIYFTDTASPTGAVINKMTEIVLLNSGLGNIEILNAIDPTSTDLDYYYKTNLNTLNTITTDSAPFVKTSDGSQIQPWSSINPVKANWINLIQNNKDQHKYGCSSGNISACACVDPSYNSPIVCNEYVLNKTTGFYCPPEHLGCSTACTAANQEGEDCGYRFCTSGTLPDPAAGSNSVAGSQPVGKGYYQNTFIPGIHDTSNPDYYTVGYKGENLYNNLGLTGDWSADTLTNYAQVQLRTMCGGTNNDSGAVGYLRNNVNNASANRGDGVDISTNIADDNYTPQFSTNPNLTNSNNFNF